jgi:hypothetical protein
VLGTCFIERGYSWYKHRPVANDGEVPRSLHD